MLLQKEKEAKKQKYFEYMYLDMDWEKLISPGTQQLQYFVTRLDKGLKYLHGIGMSHSFRLVCSKVFSELIFFKKAALLVVLVSYGIQFYMYARNNWLQTMLQKLCELVMVTSRNVPTPAAMRPYCSLKPSSLHLNFYCRNSSLNSWDLVQKYLVSQHVIYL